MHWRLKHLIIVTEALYTLYVYVCFSQHVQYLFSTCPEFIFIIAAMDELLKFLSTFMFSHNLGVCENVSVVKLVYYFDCASMYTVPRVHVLLTVL